MRTSEAEPGVIHTHTHTYTHTYTHTRARARADTYIYIYIYIHIYAHARVHDVLFSPNEDIACIRVYRYSKTRNHIRSHICCENICTNKRLEILLGNKSKITFLTLHDRYVKMDTICGAPD